MRVVKEFGFSNEVKNRASDVRQFSVRAPLCGDSGAKSRRNGASAERADWDDPSGLKGERDCRLRVR